MLLLQNVTYYKDYNKIKMHVSSYIGTTGSELLAKLQYVPYNIFLSFE